MPPTLVERLSEVGKDILCVLDASAQADEPFWDGVASPARPALGRRVDPAEAGRFVDEFTVAQEPFCHSTVGKREAHDGAEMPHLTFGDLVRRIGWQARIPHRCDIDALGEILRHTKRRLALPLQAHSSVASERCASQTSIGPGTAPICVRQTRRRSAQTSSRAATWPRIRSA